MDDAVGVAGVVAGTRSRFAAERRRSPADAAPDGLDGLSAAARQQPIATILLAAACGALVMVLLRRLAGSGE